MVSEEVMNWKPQTWWLDKYREESESASESERDLMNPEKMKSWMDVTFWLKFSDTCRKKVAVWILFCSFIELWILDGIPIILRFRIFQTNINLLQMSRLYTMFFFSWYRPSEMRTKISDTKNIWYFISLPVRSWQETIVTSVYPRSPTELAEAAK